MIVEKITQESITSKQLYYSRWHSVCTPDKGCHYDIKVAELVGPILSLIPKGTYCQFTDSEDEAYINSFFIIRDLLPKSTDVFPRDKDFTTVTEFVRAHDQTIKEFYPEKFI